MAGGVAVCSVGTYPATYYVARYLLRSRFVRVFPERGTIWDRLPAATARSESISILYESKYLLLAIQELRPLLTQSIEPGFRPRTGAARFQEEKIQPAPPSIDSAL